MTSIGRRCRDGNVYSRAILITQTLSGAQAPQKEGQAPPAESDGADRRLVQKSDSTKTRTASSTLFPPSTPAA